MTPDFTRLFTARLTGLVQDCLSWNAPTDTMIPPQVYVGMLPWHEDYWEDGALFPHLYWRVASGEIGLKPHPFRVLVDAGLRVDDRTGTLAEQIQDGTARIMALVEAMRGLCKNHVFGLYKLTLPFTFQTGDRAGGMDNDTEGEQPHPYYRARFELQFIPR